MIYRVEGVGADGATTYANDIVFSEVVVGHLNGGTTYTSGEKTVTELPPSSTVTEEPKTVHGIKMYTNPDRRASNYVWSVAEESAITYPNIIVSCALDERGSGTCVERMWQSGEPTFMTTYPGSAVVGHTLVVGDGSAGPGSTGGPKDNAAVKPVVQALVAGGAVTMSVVLGSFLGL